MVLNSIMPMINSDHIRLRDNWLIIEDNPTKISKNSISLPFVSGLDLENHSVFVSNKNNGLKIEATIQDEDQRVSLYPTYRAEETVELDEKIGGFSEIDLEVYVVNTERERQLCQNIINRNHYLSFVSGGMFVGCRFKHEEQQKAVRNNAKKKYQDTSSSNSQQIKPAWWTDPPCRIIGCGVIDDLVFGVPNGRDKFAPEIVGEETWKEFKKAEKRRMNGKETNNSISRKEMLRRLKLAWGRRFAIDKPYRGHNIGNTIAKHMKKIAKNNRLPPAERLEVIRTEEKNKAKLIMDGEKEDFLTRAGYNLVLNQYSRPKWKMDPETGLHKPPEVVDNRPQYKKLYYHAEL